MRSFNLSAWAVRHPALILFAIIVLSVAGLISYNKLGRAEDPSFTIKIAVVTALWPGATALEMQEQVADPIEKKLQELPYFDTVKTYSRPIFTAMQVQLRSNTPPSEVPTLFYQLRKKLDDIRNDLPAGVIGPNVNDEYGDVDSILYALTVDDVGEDYALLKQVAERLRQHLLKVQDVTKVNLYGAQPQRIYLEFDQSKLASLGIPLQTVFDSLARQNAVTPAGAIDTAAQRVQLRITGAPQGAEAVAETPIQSGGRIFRLGDIASVVPGRQDPPQFLVRQRGRPAVLVGVVMQKDGNILHLGENIRQAMNDFIAETPVGVTFEQIADQPAVVEEAVGEFTRSFVEALAIVLFVSFVSLGLRTGFVVSLSVPLVLAVVFIIMDMMHLNLHRVTLGALIISLGLLVDDAIIAIEMMMVKMEHGWERTRAASFAWESTAFPMLTGTLVTASGFLPIGFAASATGEYAGGIFWVVVISLLTSWIVAVTFIPYLGVKLLPDPHRSDAVKAAPGRWQAAALGVTRPLRERWRALRQRLSAVLPSVEHGALYDTPLYRRLRGAITWCVDHRLLTIGATMACLAVAILAFGNIQRQFFPRSERPELFFQMRMPEGSAIGATLATARDGEKLLKNDPDIATYTTYIGQGSPRFWLGLNPELPNPAFSEIVIVARDVTARERVKARLEHALANGALSAARVRVDRFNFGPPVGFPVQFRVVGPEAAQARAIASRVREIVDADPDTRDPHLDWGEQTPALSIEVDQGRARALGLTPQDIGLALQTQLSGATITTVRDGVEKVDVVARSAGESRLDPMRIGELTLPSRSGVPVTLNQVAHIAYIQEDPILWRRNRAVTVTVRTDIADGVQAPDVSRRIEAKLVALEATLLPGYRIETGGTVEESAKANVSLFAVFPVMLITMLGFLMIQLQSFSRLFLVALTAPLGLIGVSLALNLSGRPFGFVALLGLIALAGMIMRNTVILVDQIECDVAGGATRRTAIIDATVRRARPVVLTALAALLAMVPLSRSAFWGPMAITIMGGLFVATVLTLLFVPALYAWWFRNTLGNAASAPTASGSDTPPLKQVSA